MDDATEGLLGGCFISSLLWIGIVALLLHGCNQGWEERVIRRGGAHYEVDKAKNVKFVWDIGEEDSDDDKIKKIDKVEKVEKVDKVDAVDKAGLLED